VISSQRARRPAGDVIASALILPCHKLRTILISLGAFPADTSSSG
jgi:hypothetical protein